MDPSAVLQEMQLLRQCRHPNVLPLLGFCGDRRAPCMVTPLMRGGSLDDRLLLSPAV
jgi:serine/threonine protein kinase